jgi:diguanylate cyclase (GGDEF)-like protein
LSEKVNILIVDDEPVNLLLLEGVLRDLDVNVLKASNGSEALQLVHERDLALALLDIMMPDIDGFQVAEIMREDQRSQHVPIIFITAISKEQRHVFKGYELGAVDYLFKPVETEILRSKVKVFVELHKQKKTLERTTRELELTIERLTESEEALRRQSLYDNLTTLPNRSLCLDRIRQAVERSLRRANYHFAVAFLDVDRFKHVNDSMGPEVGDKLLIDISKRLQENIRGLDTISRFGSDEFVLIMEELSSPREGVHIANRIVQLLREPFFIEGSELLVTVSLGVTLSPMSTVRPEDLTRNASIAMQRARAAGGDRVKIFNNKMLDHAIQLITLESDLRRAIANSEFFLHYQPIVTIDGSRTVGLEALLRWRHPEKGLIGPGTFIPVAEESGLIHKLGRWVLSEACATMAEWRRTLASMNGMFLSVNISGKQFSQGDLVETVHKTLEGTGLPANILKLEITETAIMDEAEASIEKLLKLKNLGVMLSVDDFGTGYSSMSYLQRFPLDTLKIDLSFVRMLDNSPENVEIVKAIINLAHTLKLKVVAEGVEKSSQQETLRFLSCDYGQGYLFSKPIPQSAIPEFLERKTP